MNIVVSIENATDMTPYLASVNVNNATWVHFQELTVNQPIAPNKTIAGMLDPNFPFTGTIRVHYSFLPPGPGGADVDFTFKGDLLDGTPLIGCGSQSQPATAWPGTEFETHRDGNDYFLMLKVHP